MDEPATLPWCMSTVPGLSLHGIGDRTRVGLPSKAKYLPPGHGNHYNDYCWCSTWCTVPGGWWIAASTSNTSVLPGALEYANFPTMATVKSRAISCHSTVYCPRNHHLQATEFRRWGKALRRWLGRNVQDSSASLVQSFFSPGTEACLMVNPLNGVRSNRVEKVR